MQQVEQEAVLTALEQSFKQAVSKTGLKARDVCHRLLARTITKLDTVDLAACKVEQQPNHHVRVTFSTPIPDIPASLRTFKWRSPNNVAVLDEQGRWTGVVAYFREWEGFIEAAVQQVNLWRVHEANL